MILLKIDLWQSRQSGISGTGSSNWVYRKTARVGWQVEADHAKALWNHLYTGTHGQSLSTSWSHNQVRADATLSATWGGLKCLPPPLQRSTKVLSGTLNIEVQRGLRKGKYSSPLPVWIRISLSLSLSLSLSHTHTHRVSTLSRNKDERHIFVKNVLQSHHLIIMSRQYAGTWYCYIVIYTFIQHHNDTISKTDAVINDARRLL